MVSLILCVKGNQSTLSPKKKADVEYTALKSGKEQFKMYLATAENREKQLQRHFEEDKEKKIKIGRKCRDDACVSS